MTADVSPPDRDDASATPAADPSPQPHVMAGLARAVAESRGDGAGRATGSAVVAARLGAVRRTAANRAADPSSTGRTATNPRYPESSDEAGATDGAARPLGAHGDVRDEAVDGPGNDDDSGSAVTSARAEDDRATDEASTGPEDDGSPNDRDDPSAGTAPAGLSAATVLDATERHETSAPSEREPSEREPRTDDAAAGASRRRNRSANHVRARRDVRLSPLALLALALVVALLGGVVGGVVTAATTGAFGASPTSPALQPWSSDTLDEDSAEIAAAVAAAAPSVVSLRVVTPGRSEIGSGIVLSEQGRVLTNAHVVTLDGTVNDAMITATTSDGRVFRVETVGIDVLADLAVVQLDGAEGLVPATFADSTDLAVGQRVVALGSPLGLVGTATSGIVSTVHRSIDVASAAVPPSTDENADERSEAERVHLAVFQTDADINPGNSGGPVVDSGGRVVGVSVAIATTKRDPDSGPAAEGSIGLGFAIPANIAVRIAEQLTQGQLPTHGALGATLRSADRVTTLDPWIAGAYLDTVIERGAAERAGLRAGDVVTAVDGVPVATAGDLLALVRSHAGGDEVEIEYVREGTTKHVDVTLDSSAG